MARPTAPATTTTVKRYGSIEISWYGMLIPCNCMAVGIASAPPNSSAAPHAPKGVHFPTIIAASPMNPMPLVINGSKCGTDSSVKKAPPSPRSEEHTSELQSPYVISYPVFCLKKTDKLHLRILLGTRAGFYRRPHAQHEH